MWCLQIVHSLPNEGYNVIEQQYEKRFAAEAAQRRHRQRPHPNARCETYILLWEDAHAVED